MPEEIFALVSKAPDHSFEVNSFKSKNHRDAAFDRMSSWYRNKFSVRKAVLNVVFEN